MTRAVAIVVDAALRDLGDHMETIDLRASAYVRDYAEPTVSRGCTATGAVPRPSVSHGLPPEIRAWLRGLVDEALVANGPLPRGDA